MQREWQILGRRLAIHKGDITRLAVDAIVSSENSDLVMDAPDGPSVSAAIRRIEGEDLARDVARLGPIEPGRAVVTPARRLPCRWVIHAAAVVRGEAGGADAHASSLALVREAVRSSLRLAAGLGLRSIAFPAFAVRAAGLPRELASAAMVEELVAGLREPTPLREVVVALLDAESFLAFFEAAIARAAAASEPLRLRAARAGDELAWSVDDDAPVARTWSRPLAAGALAAVDEGLARLRDHGARRLLSTRDELRALGARTAALVPDDVRERLRAAAPGPVVVALDEELARLPLELLDLGDRPLGLALALGRRLVARGGTGARAAGGGPTPRRTDAAPGRLRAVVLAPEAAALPGAAREVAHLVDLLWRRAGDRLDLRLLAGPRAGLGPVRDALAHADLVHWAGHTRDGPRGEPRWPLGDGAALDPATLGDPGLAARLVVASSCGRAPVALARALLLAGARNVVGALWDTDDAATERLALALYEALALGRPLGDALLAARAAVAADDPLDAAAWVHWGDPRERLVEPAGLGPSTTPAGP